MQTTSKDADPPNTNIQDIKQSLKDMVDKCFTEAMTEQVNLAVSKATEGINGPSVAASTSQVFANR